MVRPVFRALLSVAALLPIALSAAAQLSAENVAVVVNGDSWASLTVANEYARLRRIPPSNFIVLTGLTSVETTDVDHFRKEILGPVFSAIEVRGLVKKIDSIAYSVDIPYAVNVTSDMTGKKFPMVITGMASTNGLTYLHELVEKKDTEYLRLDINRYCRRTLPLPKGSSLTPAETADLARGLELYEQKHYLDAASILSKLLSIGRSDPDIAYDLACDYSLGGKLDEAVATLQKAVESGWRNAVQTTSDPDLKPLAGRGDFKALVEKMKSMPLKVQSGIRFRSQIAWGSDGTPAGTGPHYMLSTMLGVTCGRGNSVNEVLESLRRSAVADGTRPKGTVFFPENGDVRSTTRAWAFRAAASELKSLGVDAVVENGVLPVNRPDVAGAMIGTAGFDWAGSKSKILPGAIVEHLTSFGAVLTERSDQTPCTAFIRAGASGSSGTVTEPFALQQKFPTAFIQVLYAKGFSLAESFYQSVSGPYQLLVIGDPLCRPWAASDAIAKKGPTTAKQSQLKARIGSVPAKLSEVSVSFQYNEIGVSYPGARSIELQHLGRTIGRVIGAKGSIKVSATVCGCGVLSLIPVAHLAAATVVGIPIQVEVMPPTTPSSTPLAGDEKQQPGLTLSIDRGDPVVVRDTIDPGWLAALVKGPSQHFKMSGTFESTTADLYQVQLKTNTRATVKIDGVNVLGANDDRQLFAPVALPPGHHRMEIIGVAPQGATMDIRLGSAGILHLAAAQFSHVVK